MNAHCCQSLDLADRERAAILGLTCSESTCAREQLANARPALTIVRSDGR